MPTYRCRLIGKRGQEMGAEMFQAAVDTVARTRAEELLLRHGYAAVEVSRGSELIYRAERGAELCAAFLRAAFFAFSIIRARCSNWHA